MPPRKTTTLTLRIDPAIKEGLRLAAEREHRSMTNMFEVLIRDYCEREGIGIPEQAERFEEQSRRSETQQ